MKIAMIGGGINGLTSAWQLAQAGHQVQLFERDELMKATSAASSKLLHGGLRYLEQGELRLVHEALQERRWWIKKAEAHSSFTYSISNLSRWPPTALAAKNWFVIVRFIVWASRDRPPSLVKCGANHPL